MNTAEIRYCNQNPTYIVTFSRQLVHEALEERLGLIAFEVEMICRASIWADPHIQHTKPIPIDQMTQIINKKLRMKYGESAANEVHIERLCMKPLADPEDEDKEHGDGPSLHHQGNSADQDLGPQGSPGSPKYGGDKDVRTAAIYVRCED